MLGFGVCALGFRVFVLVCWSLFVGVCLLGCVRVWSVFVKIWSLNVRVWCLFVRVWSLPVRVLVLVC